MILEAMSLSPITLSLVSSKCKKIELDKETLNSHRIKWDHFPPNEVGRIVQHVTTGEGRNEGKVGVG